MFLAVFPTGYSRNFIDKMSSCPRQRLTINGQATILAISPLVSNIKDQIQDIESIVYSAIDISELRA